MMAIDPNSAVGKAIKNGNYVPSEEAVHIVWWKSKKFIAYMWGELTWKVLLGGMLYVIAHYHDGVMSGSWMTILFTVIVTAGVAQMGYLGGQAWIDRYAGVVKSSAELGKSVIGGVVEAVSEVKGPMGVDGIEKTSDGFEDDEEGNDDEE